jgi:hypothetical protein
MRVSPMLSYDRRRRSRKSLGVLNRKVHGWANYFCLGPVSQAHRAVEQHACRRVPNISKPTSTARTILCRKTAVARGKILMIPRGLARFVFRKSIDSWIVRDGVGMKAKLFFLLWFFLMFRVVAIAQTGSGKTPETSTDVGKSAKWDSLSHQARSGDYLLGKVIVVGEPLLWDPVPITVKCDGKIRYTANADPKGNFEIAMGSRHPLTRWVPRVGDPNPQLNSSVAQSKPLCQASTPARSQSQTATFSIIQILAPSS